MVLVNCIFQHCYKLLVLFALMSGELPGKAIWFRELFWKGPHILTSCFFKSEQWVSEF